MNMLSENLKHFTLNQVVNNFDYQLFRRKVKKSGDNTADLADRSLSREPDAPC